MTPEGAVEIVRQALMMAFWVSAPLLAIGLIAGILVSLVQTVTSIQDSAFGTIPRIAAFVVAFLVSMPWMLRKMMVYASAILGDLGRYGR